MLLYGNEREIQQGEEWNLDILVSQSEVEYIPFIVSSERHNPMWAITIASTKYEKNERYVTTWWLDLLRGEGEALPRFYQTVPQYVGEIAISTPISTIRGSDLPMHALYQYQKAEDAVDPVTGHKPYYYVYFEKEDPNTPQYDYECRIRMPFRSSETSKWGSQNYMYQITLVDTVDMADYIQMAHDEYPDLPWKAWVTRDNPNWEKPLRLIGESDEDYNARVEESWHAFNNVWIMTNVEELYKFIKNRIPDWFQSDIDIDAPVGHIDVPQIILPPTKLQVNNNLRRII